MIPANFANMKVRELQVECDRWSIQTRGTKDELKSRLDDCFAGQVAVPQSATPQVLRPRVQPLAAKVLQSPKARVRSRSRAVYFEVPDRWHKPSLQATRPDPQHPLQARARRQHLLPARRPTTMATRTPTTEEPRPGPRFDAGLQREREVCLDYNPDSYFELARPFMVC